MERDTPLQRLFFFNLVFTTFFVFLFSISAFGVVWYGIPMYGTFLFLITISLYYLSSYDKKEDTAIIESRFFLSFLIFIIPCIYLILSTVPYYLSNTTKASYATYKIGKTSEKASLFLYHPEYVNILYALNIASGKRDEILLEYKNEFIRIVDKYPFDPELLAYSKTISDIETLDGIIKSLLGARGWDKDVKLAPLE